jgi:hypothetical protein
VNPFQRLGDALDSLWASIDPDEPMFCDCEGSRWCTDCALSGAVEPSPDWTVSAPPIAAA